MLPTERVKEEQAVTRPLSAQRRDGIEINQQSQEIHPSTSVPSAEKEAEAKHQSKPDSLGRGHLNVDRQQR